MGYDPLGFDWICEKWANDGIFLHPQSSNEEKRLVHFE